MSASVLISSAAFAAASSASGAATCTCCTSTPLSSASFLKFLWFRVWGANMMSRRREQVGLMALFVCSQTIRAQCSLLSRMRCRLHGNSVAVWRTSVCVHLGWDVGAREGGAGREVGTSRARYRLGKRPLPPLCDEVRGRALISR